MPTSAAPNLLKTLSLSGKRSRRGGTVDQPALYKYEPIREGDDFRLLKLRREKPGDVIRADLRTFPFHSRRAYSAVSYTWADENGDTTKCCHLEIGPRRLLLPITRNCDSVLRRVRERSRWIWIDAVCIDQDNVRERSRQVDMMALIYKSAWRTFAYIGEASNDSDLVLRNLSDGVWTPPHLLDPFLARPYFSRVWVVQEVVLSRKVIMMCGDTAVQWTLNENLRQIYTSSYYETFPTLFRLERIHQIRVATILDALLVGRSCNASDPRDKVFALLGLVDVLRRPSANYSMSTAEVYTKITTDLYKPYSQKLDVILGNLCYRSDEAREQTKNLPSWVPDWNQCGPTLLQRVPQAQKFLADQDPIFEYKDETGLFLRGSILGTLDTFKENTNFCIIDIHLANSRSRSVTTLPPVYRGRAVYVFLTGYRTRTLESSEAKGTSSDWDDISFRLSPPDETYAFLVARIDSSEASESDSLEQWESDSQVAQEVFGGAKDGSRSNATGAGTTMKAATGLQDGDVGANHFEFLGLVEVLLRSPLPEIVSRNSRVLQTTYTTGPYTIKIV